MSNRNSIRAAAKPTVNETAKAALIAAFRRSGIKNADFARAADISEAMACQLRDPYASNKIENIEKGLFALGKRIEIKIVAMLAAIILPASATSQPLQPWQLREPPCVVTADVTVNTYTGPIFIGDLCLTLGSYSNNHLQVEAIDLGGGIFKDGFDGVVP